MPSLSNNRFHLLKVEETNEEVLDQPDLLDIQNQLAQSPRT